MALDSHDVVVIMVVMVRVMGWGVIAGTRMVSWEQEGHG
jgi:hypothetical protein